MKKMELVAALMVGCSDAVNLDAANRAEATVLPAKLDLTNDETVSELPQTRTLTKFGYGKGYTGGGGGC